jgi:TPR repeat protein
MQAGYLPAMYLVASVQQTESNPYGVKLNLEESSRLFAAIYERTHEPVAAIRTATVLGQLKRYGQARSILETCADASTDAKLMLADLLSPIFGKGEDAARAVQLYEALVEEGSVVACMHLARHLQEGVGVAVDRDRAVELMERANAMDPDQPVTTVVQSIPVVLIMGVVGVAAVAATVFFLWMRSRRK